MSNFKKSVSSISPLHDVCWAHHLHCFYFFPGFDYSSKVLQFLWGSSVLYLAMASPLQIFTGIVVSVIMGVVVWLLKHCFYGDDTVSPATPTQSARFHTNVASTVLENQSVVVPINNVVNGVETNVAPTPPMAPENQSVVVTTNTVSAGVLTNAAPTLPMMLENRSVVFVINNGTINNICRD